MLDISASGCKTRFAGDVSKQLQPGQIYEVFCAPLSVGKLETAIELRHVRYDDKLDVTFAGLHFDNLSGLQQRLIERFVYQLQREARRFESDTFL